MTIAIILSTHGSASRKLLDTTEMIIGKQQNIAWVDLLPMDNSDILINKYNLHLSNLNTNIGVLFLVDMWGGTPFNSAQKIILDKENYDIITGVNIPMLIEICMARNDVSSIKKLVKIALQSGSESIKSVKYSSDNHDSKKITHTSSNNNIINESKLTCHDHMTICIARIDDRLIHGQVVTRWAKEYNINRIIVINDDIANDVIRRNLLTQVTPPGITAHVVDIKKAIRVYNNSKYSKDKVIMLFTNPMDVIRLIEGGIAIPSVNIGGMAFRQGKKQINNVISVDNTDIQAFKKLDALGVELEIRKVPSDSALNLIKLINSIY